MNARQPVSFVSGILVVMLAARCVAAADSAIPATPSRTDGKAAVAGKPVKVFILAGQSNMQGHAHIRTFDTMELDPKTAPILKEMRNADGSPRVCDKVWISSIGSADEEQIGKLTVGFGAKERGPKIGPEFTFGIYMQKLLGEPIVIIKTAWGGKSLNTDFRPPSAGPYEFNESQLEQFKKQGKDIAQIKADKARATGLYYRLMIEHVKKALADIKRIYPDYDPRQGHELAGFVWLQGWNDMVDSSTYPNRDKAGGYDQYSVVLAHFIRDVRKDLSAPKLPFVIGVMGVGGPVEKYPPDQQRYKTVHQNFRLAMAAPALLPEFKGNVVNVLTEQYWDMEVVALREREKAIKPKADEINKQVKAGTLTREAGNAAVEKLYAETFTPRDLRILRESTSNADFHYMGSAKIMAQIGKGFAEAMVNLQTRAGLEKEEDGLPEGFAGGGIGALLETQDGTLTITRLREERFTDRSVQYEVFGTFMPGLGTPADKAPREELLVFGRKTAKPKDFLDYFRIVVGAKIPCVRKVFEATMIHAGGVQATGRTTSYIYFKWQSALAAADPSRPNIVLILADDLGYGDVGCYNDRAKAPTPNLDRLATTGMRFTDAHSPATVCTPSRYALMTGQMAFRVPRGGAVFAGVGGPSLIAPGRLTLPAMLRSKGYATACIGKWHIGLTFFDKDGQPIRGDGVQAVQQVDFSRRIEGGPLDHGFDLFFGTACCPTTDWLYAFIDGDRVPVPPGARLDKTSLPKHPYANDCREGLIARDFPMEEIDLVFLKKSQEFLESHVRTSPGKPFFLYHATQAVHLPSFAAARFKGKTQAGPHGDFILQLDFVVGEILATLDRLGVADNTLVIFSSDNGPETTSVIHMRADYGHDGARPWRGMKRDDWDGGHRVPFIVSWPGKVKPGTISAQLTSLTDLMATFAAIVGADLPNDAAEDSFNMLPALLGQDNGPIRPYLLQQAFGGPRYLSIRRGNWKYLDHPGSGGNNYEKDPQLKPFMLPDAAPGAPGQLYNLDADPAESRNLYFEQPQIVKDMKALLDQAKASGRSRGSVPALLPANKM